MIQSLFHFLGDEDEEPESGEIIEEESKDQHEYYNKANSFFDNISCEATDPHGERITRSAERKLNSETFGITGNNRNYNRRGGYNKRGGDRNRVIISTRDFQDRLGSFS